MPSRNMCLFIEMLVKNTMTVDYKTKIRTEPGLSACLQWENLSRHYVVSLRAVRADYNIGLTSVFFLTYSSYYFVTFFDYRQVQECLKGRRVSEG